MRMNWADSHIKAHFPERGIHLVTKYSISPQEKHRDIRLEILLGAVLGAAAMGVLCLLAYWWTY